MMTDFITARERLSFRRSKLRIITIVLLFLLTISLLII